MAETKRSASKKTAPTTLEQWRAAKQAAAEVQDIIKEEQRLRKAVIDEWFEGMVEGSRSTIAEGFVLTLTQPFTRTIDVASLDSIKPALAKADVALDDVVLYEPKLQTKVYRMLTDKQRNLFDRALTIKPGSPTLALKEKED